MKKQLTFPLRGNDRTCICIQILLMMPRLAASCLIFTAFLSNKSAAQTTYTANYLLKSYTNSAEYVNCQIFDDGLNVGINNAFPSEKLDVVGGNVRTSGAFISLIPAGNPPLILSSPTLVSNLNSDYLDGFHSADFSLSTHTHPGMISGSGIPSQVAFWSSAGVLSGQDALFWDNYAHHLGIGIDAPEADLHLYSGTNETSIYLSETHPDLNNILRDTKWSISNQAGQFRISTFNNGSAINIIKITGTQNAGTFEVNGTLRTSRLVMSSGAQNNFLLVSSASGAAFWRDPALITGWRVAGNNVLKDAGSVGIGTSLTSGKLNVQTTNVPAIVFEVANGYEGSLGAIAKVSSPNVAAFSVEQSGTPTMMIWGDGRIYATKIRVKVPAFPDFVFSPNYSLPKLGDLEQYIQKNRHLPGIPTADSVVSEGLDLGSMNTQLLQKVEELTLYIIELNKEINALKKQVITLDNKNLKSKKR